MNVELAFLVAADASTDANCFGLGVGDAVWS